MSRSSVKLTRDRGRNRNPKLIVVATEGSDSERVYLEYFDDNSKVIVIPIPNQNNQSSPQHVLDNLENFIQRGGTINDVGRYQFDMNKDEFWIMLDTDHWIRPNHVQNFSFVTQQAFQKGYKLAISNSSFEVWLYLHLTDLSIVDEGQNASYFEGRIRSILGSFNKLNPKKEVFYPHINVAIERSRVLFEHDDNRWPQITGSHVFRLIESILDSY